LLQRSKSAAQGLSAREELYGNKQDKIAVATTSGQRGIGEG
jgi:hypothetical protein